MLLNKLYKVMQTQAAGEWCRKQDSESLIHIMTTTDRRALRDNQEPEQGSRRGGRINSSVCCK